MKILNNKYYNESLLKLIEVESETEFDKSVKDILQTFSAYIVNYDEDYLYNYKFIDSHIEPFLISLRKAVSLQKKCKNIEKIISDPIQGLIEFINVLKYNYKASLTIKINEAIEISTSNKDDKDVIKIDMINPPSVNSLKYDNEFDIKVIFKYDEIEYQRNYKRVSIMELMEKKTIQRKKII
ncbi:hypothetical protein [Clostridium sp.]|jgi:hypothetical protein|uniref:hypothetical protein n=1 Tax=Clostridium sp. TaxID=1506 RepID=UPI003EECC16A